MGVEQQKARPQGTPDHEPISPPIEKPVLPVTGSAPASPAVLFRAPDLSTGIVMRNLLNDLTGLAEALQSAIFRADWLDAYLFAAGMWQIAEDYLHYDPLSLQRAEKVFEGLNHPLVMLPRGSVRISRKVENILYQRTPSFQQVLRWSAAWSELAEALAEAAIDPAPLPAEQQAHLSGRALILLKEIEAFPTRLKRLILKLPNCFRSFDQQPADVQRLAERFVEQHPDRSQPIVVVGLRTSGSYLALLLKCYLHRLGFAGVALMTLRPGSDLLPSERSQIRRSARQGALFTLIDDPPVTGRSIHEAARDLERAQVAAQSIILLVPLFAGLDSLPPLLNAYESIVLPWKEWAIRASITPQAVLGALSGMLQPGLEIKEIEPISVLLNDNGRGHITALYRLVIRQPMTGQCWQRDIFIKGTGLGYFGMHVLDSIQQLAPYFPAFYGLRDGLLFRAWISEEEQLNHLSDQDLPAAARAMVRYIWERHQKLPVSEDTSLRRFGELPAWEVASNLVGRVYGRAWRLARVPLVDPLMLRLLKSDSPSIVDGNTALVNWFYQPAHSQVKKAAFERGVFRNDVEYTSYDPIFDLASLASELDTAVLEGKSWAETLLAVLRPEYERLSGQKIDEERWLLYQLVHLYEIKRTLTITQSHILGRAYSRALQRYFAAYYFCDLPAIPEDEPDIAPDICAFDLDGVLETNYLGFPALSPSSAAALRTLVQHGCQSILVTGRSLPEVIERCTLYPVIGGVAEYGAIFYTPANGKVCVLLNESEQAVLASLRKYLQAELFVFVDPDYQYAVRAYRLDASGRRVGLSTEQVHEALQALPSGSPAIRPIPGEDQTDFMAERVDKALGVRALLAALNGSEPEKTHPLALAIGDSLSDLPMLRLAQHAAAPAHADRRLNQPGIRRYPKAYQAGVAMAVDDFLRARHRRAGHAHMEPCPQCHEPVISDNARRLLALFAVQENGTRSILRSLFRKVN